MVAMPNVLVLIVCKVVLLGPIDPHTGWQNTEFEMSDGKMHCRRIQQELYDPSVDAGADPKEFNSWACMQAAMRLGPQYDVDATNAKRPWRFYRAACPTPIMSSGPDGIEGNRDDTLIGWHIPECGDVAKDRAVCDQDTEI